MEQRANLILARRDGFMRNQSQDTGTLRGHLRDERAPAPLQYATVPPPLRKWFARAAVALSAYPLLVLLSIHVVPVFHGPQYSAEFIAYGLARRTVAWILPFMVIHGVVVCASVAHEWNVGDERRMCLWIILLPLAAWMGSAMFIAIDPFGAFDLWID